jgi:hypothetical protein
VRGLGICRPDTHRRPSARGALGTSGVGAPVRPLIGVSDALTLRLFAA